MSQHPIPCHVRGPRGQVPAIRLAVVPSGEAVEPLAALGDPIEGEERPGLPEQPLAARGVELERPLEGLERRRVLALGRELGRANEVLLAPESRVLGFQARGGVEVRLRVRGPAQGPAPPRQLQPARGRVAPPAPEAHLPHADGQLEPAGLLRVRLRLREPVPGILGGLLLHVPLGAQRLDERGDLLQDRGAALRQAPGEHLERARREPARPDDLGARERVRGLLAPLPPEARAQQGAEEGPQRELEGRLSPRGLHRARSQGLVEEGVEAEEGQGAVLDLHAERGERRSSLRRQLGEPRASLGDRAVPRLVLRGPLAGPRRLHLSRAKGLDLRPLRGRGRQRERSLVEARGQVGAAHALEVTGLEDPAVRLERRLRGADLLPHPAIERLEPVLAAVLQALVDLPDRVDLVPALQDDPGREHVVGLGGVFLPLAPELAAHQLAEEGAEAHDGRPLAVARPPAVVVGCGALLAPGEVDERVEGCHRGGVELERQQGAVPDDRLLGDRGIVAGRRHGVPPKCTRVPEDPYLRPRDRRFR